MLWPTLIGKKNNGHIWRLAGKSRAPYFNLAPNTDMQISRIEMIANPIISGGENHAFSAFLYLIPWWAYGDRISDIRSSTVSLLLANSPAMAR
jgi:hypothetical protein